MNNKSICCIGLPKSGTTHLTQVLYNCDVQILHDENNIYESNLNNVIKHNLIDNSFFKKPNIIFNRFQIKKLINFLEKKQTNCLIIIFLTDFNKCLYKLYKLKTSKNRDVVSHDNITYNDWVNNDSILTKKNTNIGSFSEIENNIIFLIDKIKDLKNIDLIIFRENTYSHDELVKNINLKGYNLQLKPKTIININNNFIWFKTHKIDINIFSTIYQLDSLPNNIIYYKINLDKILSENNRYFNFSITDITIYDNNNNLIISNISEIVNNLNNYFLIQINNKNFFFINNNCGKKNLLNKDIQKYPEHESLAELYNNLLENNKIKPYLI